MNEDRILKTKDAMFVLRTWDGQNHSGLEPVCDKVLVLVDEMLEKTKGGIIVPGSVQETGSMGSTTGILISVGPQAFIWDSDRTTKWEGDKPIKGMRICFERYAGALYMGLDGKEYRIMQDRSVGGTMGMALAKKSMVPPVAKRITPSHKSSSTITGFAPAA